MNLTFVKNDSYEKGNDLVVVHVYVKEIHKETSKVLFREQDFTLVFQTRYERALGWHQADAELLAAARPLCLFSSSHLLLISLQRRKLPSPPPWLRAPHGVPVAGEAQVWSQISSQHRGEGAESWSRNRSQLAALCRAQSLQQLGSQPRSAFLTPCCTRCSRPGMVAEKEIPAFPCLQPDLELSWAEPEQPVCTLLGRPARGGTWRLAEWICWEWGPLRAVCLGLGTSVLLREGPLGVDASQEAVALPNRDFLASLRLLGSLGHSSLAACLAGTSLSRTSARTTSRCLALMSV